MLQATDMTLPPESTDDSGRQMIEQYLSELGFEAAIANFPKALDVERTWILHGRVELFLMLGLTGSTPTDIFPGKIERKWFYT